MRLPSRRRHGDESLNATLTLVDLAGFVALLLWGVHMVQTGIQRAFGLALRRALGAALANRGRAFLAGLGATAALQSSTVTGLMVASFAAGGLVNLVPALAAMLGANIGTTLIVQALAFDLSHAGPLAVFAGLLMFRRGAARIRDLGRVAVGLGLMLIALRLLLELVAPLGQAPALRVLLQPVTTEPLLALLLAAVLTWAAHSSVAIVLLVASLAARGVVPPEAAFALVIGANLGGALNPVLEGAAGPDGAGRRLPLGNLLNRLAGCAIGVASLPVVAPWLSALVPEAGRAVAIYHTGFNLVLAVLFMPLLGPLARLLAWLLPARAEAADPARPLYLDEGERRTPSLALAGAAREALRMVDIVAAMLRNAAAALEGNAPAEEARRLEQVLDRLNAAIQAYLVNLDADELTADDQRRLSEILVFTANLGHAGDVLDRNVLAAAARRRKQGIAPGSSAELREAVERLEANLRAAAAVFMTGDTRAARGLAAEKEAFRDLESRATAAHLLRLRNGEAERSGDLHLALLRDLKRVNTHLVAAGAYPRLEAEGELLPSRLRGA